MKRLSRSANNKIIAGVCGGIAEYFNIDPIIIRIIWLFSGAGIILYIILAVILPVQDYMPDEYHGNEFHTPDRNSNDKFEEYKNQYERRN